MSICLVESNTSAKDAGVGRPSCIVPEFDAELESLSPVLLMEDVKGSFPPALPGSQMGCKSSINHYSLE